MLITVSTKRQQCEAAAALPSAAASLPHSPLLATCHMPQAACHNAHAQYNDSYLHLCVDIVVICLCICIYVSASVCVCTYIYMLQLNNENPTLTRRPFRCQASILPTSAMAFSRRRRPRPELPTPPLLLPSLLPPVVACLVRRNCNRLAVLPPCHPIKSYPRGGSLCQSSPWVIA